MENTIKKCITRCPICHRVGRLAFTYENNYKGYFVKCNTCGSWCRLWQPFVLPKELTPEEWLSRNRLQNPGYQNSRYPTPDYPNPAYQSPGYQNS